jgi:phosphatidylglycerol:prolipoprotein diacylglycerol transferase
MSTLLLADAYLHRLDPFAIHISGSFGLRWYGLSYAAGFLASWWLIRWLARTGRTTLAMEAVGDLMFYVIAGVLVGGRVGYVVFYEPALLGFSDTMPYWDLLAINKGGMASHGGMIGVIAACMVFARRRKIASLPLIDLCAFTCPIGLSLGRVANFVNGELWGKALPGPLRADAPWWSVKYPREVTDVWLRAINEPALFPPGIVESAPARLDELERFRAALPNVDPLPHEVVEAAYAGKTAVVEGLPELLTAYYPSQIIQAISDGPVLIGALALVWLRPRKPGVVGAWFLFVYGVLRVATEVYREPDRGVALLLGLSRGQILSVLLALAGVVCIVIAARRSDEPVGGLLRPR